MKPRTNLRDLFQSEKVSLQRFLRRFSREGAEDLAQEAFARLCAADEETIESPRAYLFQTARNLAINESRRRRIAPVRYVGDVAALAMPASDPTPEEQVLKSEALLQLQTALSELPDRQRQALILFKVEGLSHKEIGKRLGVSHRTVERYVADALAHCHAALRAREE